jgi:outer membrane biosynthesis protein TonB
VPFCGKEPEATPTPEPEPTPTPEPEVTPTPEPEVTPTPEPTGSVAVETGTPNVTPPSTDTIEPQGPSSTNSTPILLFLGALVALAALVTPSARAKSRPR